VVFQDALLDFWEEQNKERNIHGFTFLKQLVQTAKL
jgi:hypothetical protein